LHEQVGPYANPQEAYEYYTLPYCAPNNDKPHLFNKAKTGQYLGELLGGHSLRSSGHDLVFAPDAKGGSVKEECTTQPLSAAEAELFSHAVAEHWFYQLYLDDLPVWGMVGEVLSEKDPQSADGVTAAAAHMASTRGKSLAELEKEGLLPYVYTERVLHISYNKDRIVKLDLTSEPHSLVRVKPGTALHFSFTFSWEESNDISYEGRFDRYLDHAFFKHQIHWFSIFNSFMMVLFLTGLVALILLRTLKADYARYSTTAAVGSREKGDDIEDGDYEESAPLTTHVPTEDSGWKQVHGDVFRAPAHLPLLAALLGTGCQLLILTVGLILFAVAGPIHGGDVYEERGTILHAAIVLYALSASVAGYASGKYYHMYTYRKVISKSKPSPQSVGWQTTMGLTVVLCPTCVMLILSTLNMMSLYYGTIHTISFLTILKLFAMWVFVSVPLCIIGTLAGRHKMLGDKGAVHPFPCRVNAIPRPIPGSQDVPWYGRPLFLVPLSGLLPFGSIFIELYYVLTSLWNYKFYHVYGFMLGVYTILMIVTAMTSVISVYFCLNSGENYLWHWVSFYSGASTAVYVFLYGVYYFCFKTSMYGLLQTSFYFGYTALIAAGLGTLCGTLGHFAAERFVRMIFQNVKVD
jgi:transmembrane 9 superfamily protein 3